MKKIFAPILLIALLLTGCAKQSAAAVLPQYVLDTSKTIYTPGVAQHASIPASDVAACELEERLVFSSREELVEHASKAREEFVAQKSAALGKESLSATELKAAREEYNYFGVQYYLDFVTVPVEAKLAEIVVKETAIRLQYKQESNTVLFTLVWHTQQEPDTFIQSYKRALTKNSEIVTIHGNEAIKVKMYDPDNNEYVGLFYVFTVNGHCVFLYTEKQLEESYGEKFIESLFDLKAVPVFEEEKG